MWFGSASRGRDGERHGCGRLRHHQSRWQLKRHLYGSRQCRAENRGEGNRQYGLSERWAADLSSGQRHLHLQCTLADTHPHAYGNCSAFADSNAHSRSADAHPDTYSDCSADSYRVASGDSDSRANANGRAHRYPYTQANGRSRRHSVIHGDG